LMINDRLEQDDESDKEKRLCSRPPTIKDDESKSYPNTKNVFIRPLVH
jgi:hypothetical protein